MQLAVRLNTGQDYVIARRRARDHRARFALHREQHPDDSNRRDRLTERLQTAMPIDCLEAPE